MAEVPGGAARRAAEEFFFSGAVPKSTEHAIEYLAAVIAKHFPAAAQPAEAQNVVMYEDDLPADMPQEDYDRWFARSWVPDGVGCRVGPLYPFPGPAPTPEAAPARARALTEEKK